MRELRSLPQVTVKPQLGTPRQTSFKGLLGSPPSPGVLRGAKPTAARTAGPAHQTLPVRPRPIVPVAVQPSPLKGPVVAAQPSVKAIHAERRQGHVIDSQLKAERRDAHSTTAEEQTSQRARDELKILLITPPPVPPLQGTPPPPPIPRVDAERALAMVEKVQRFERAGRPGLRLQIAGLGREVEIERAGKGVVALRMLGKGEALSPSLAQQLRKALAQQGLALRSLDAA